MALQDKGMLAAAQANTEVGTQPPAPTGLSASALCFPGFALQGGRAGCWLKHRLFGQLPTLPHCYHSSSLPGEAQRVLHPRSGSPNAPSRLGTGNRDKADTAPSSPIQTVRWLWTQRLIAVHGAVLGAGPGMLALLTRRRQLLPVGGSQHREC